MQEIRKELRERPQARGGHRERLMLPTISKVSSHRQLSKIEEKSPGPSLSSSVKTIKIKNYERMRELMNKETSEKVGELVGSKLLTEGRELLSFGKARVLINKLRAVSPLRATQKPKKLITE
jgi:ribosomal protein L18